jgi:hypothetical protein
MHPLSYPVLSFISRNTCKLYKLVTAYFLDFKLKECCYSINILSKVTLEQTLYLC